MGLNAICCIARDASGLDGILIDKRNTVFRAEPGHSEGVVEVKVAEIGFEGDGGGEGESITGGHGGEEKPERS